MTEEEKERAIKESKAVTRRIEEDVRILVGVMDDIGQTEISVLISGWEVHIKKIADDLMAGKKQK